MSDSTIAGFDPQAVETWLRALHGRHDGTGYYTVSWTTPGGPLASRHFAVADGLEPAVELIRGLDATRPAGIYARVTSITDRPEKRGGANISYTLPALWADIDIAGPGHKRPEGDDVVPLPADEQQARSIVAESGLPEPTMWIHSGGGLYPIWLLDPVPVISEHLEQAKALSRDWQDVLGKAAGRLGLHYGTEVSDLSRVLRVPGTVNRKNNALERPCRFLSTGGPTYTSRQLRDAVTARQPEPQPAPEPQQARREPPRPGGFDWDAVWNDDGVKPGDDFNERATADVVVEMLTEVGWTVDHEDGSKIYLRRPGKTDAGHSATVDRTTRGFWVFSGDAHPFRAHREGIDKGERPFSVYAILHHGGNYSEAARALGRSGFGKRSSHRDASQHAKTSADGGSDDGEPEPAAAETTGGELPSPSQPLAVARRLVARMHTPRCWWRGDFYQWQGTRWDTTEPSVIEYWIYRQTEHAEYLHVDAKGVESMRAWAPNKKRITDVAHALGVGALQRFGEAEHVLAITNGVLGIATRKLVPHSPDRFNLFSLPFAYDADAACPAWLAFLQSVLPDDGQAHEFLAEWFGYVLSGRTDQQKMAALIGERRSGKGTIARVLTAMLGQENVAGLDLNLLPGNFGMENLIGKALAVSGDVRWHSRNVGDAVPILLSVIGEDSVTVHRKNRDSWNGRLGTRFMMMSNDTPTFSDRSGALGGRMIYVKFDQSFYGREDVSLTDKLLAELPGILNWALDGLDRLNGRRRFTEPESGQAEADAVRRLSDPIGAFIEDWCVLGLDESIGLDLLFLRYRSWCESEGRTRDTTTKEIFSRDLRSKVPELVVKRERISGKQVRNLYGISCAAASPFESSQRPF